MRLETEQASVGPGLADDPTNPGRIPRVLIVAPHASVRFGGEAVLPVHYFRGLRRRGVEVWMLVHERTRDELLELFPDDAERLVFIRDDNLQRFLWKLSRIMPARVHRLTVGTIMHMIEGRKQRRQARDLVRERTIDVVHQPIPVSPKEPSPCYHLGAPVVIGPLNGGMSFPPAFASMESRLTRFTVRLARVLSRPLNRMMPGKRQAHTILVANARTRDALPAGLRGQVVELVENGVDLAVWTPPERDTHAAPDTDTDTDTDPAADHRTPTRFIFLGRLVDWKAVDLLVEAFARLINREKTPAHLTVVGDGPEAPALRARVAEHNLEEHVTFTGWLKPEACARKLAESDVLVLPSLLECGGAVVLEAMACARPAIATHWGGPADYLDETCGILIAPTSASAMIDALTEAMRDLADSPERREAMGRAGRRRIETDFDWQTKVARMLWIYHEAAGLPVPVALQAEAGAWRGPSRSPAELVHA